MAKMASDALARDQIITEVMIEHDKWRAQPRLLALITDTVAVCVRASGASPPVGCELSLLLTDDHNVRELNRQYRGCDKPTNILSFSQKPVEEAPLLGDIVIAYQTTAREALDQGVSFEHHICHLVAHGLLHLLGYNHKTEVQARKMEGLEKSILETMGYYYNEK